MIKYFSKHALFLFIGLFVVAVREAGLTGATRNNRPRNKRFVWPSTGSVLYLGWRSIRAKTEKNVYRFVFFFLFLGVHCEQFFGLLQSAVHKQMSLFWGFSAHYHAMTYWFCSGFGCVYFESNKDRQNILFYFWNRLGNIVL